jgi:hypothetical protein
MYVLLYESSYLFFYSVLKIKAKKNNFGYKFKIADLSNKVTKQFKIFYTILHIYVLYRVHDQKIGSENVVMAKGSFKKNLSQA